jgi:hypothetical protein
MPRIVPTRALVVILWLLPSLATIAQEEIRPPEPTLDAQPANAVEGVLFTETGEEGDLEEPEPIDAYHVELILFSRRVNESAVVEREPLYYRRPDRPGFSPGIYNAPEGPLHEEVARLVRSPEYEVWTYASWRQVSARTGASPRVQVQSLAPAFTGWLTVYDNNILLSELDIEFIPERDRILVTEAEVSLPGTPSKTDLPTESITNDEFDESPQEPEPEVTPEPESRYRINERRRVRFNEQHYFDHPRFGVLLRVERAEITINETLGILEEEVEKTLEDQKSPPATVSLDLEQQ